MREENAALKRRLKEQDAPEDDGGGGLFGGLARTLGFGKTEEEKRLERQQAQIGKEIDEVFKGGGLVGSMVGALAKGAIGMVGKAFAEGQADMDNVLRSMERALAAQLGDGVQCDPPMQQMYSSSNINGRVTKQVQLVTSARGSRGRAAARRSRAGRGDGDTAPAGRGDAAATA